MLKKTKRPGRYWVFLFVVLHPASCGWWTLDFGVLEWVVLCAPTTTTRWGVIMSWESIILRAGGFLRDEFSFSLIFRAPQIARTTHYPPRQTWLSGRTESPPGPVLSALWALRQYSRATSAQIFQQRSYWCTTGAGFPFLLRKKR
jgi:hypothetical protein